MAGTPINYGGEDILCNDAVIGVASGPGQTGLSPGQPIGGGMNSAKYSLRAVDFNSAATDHPITISLPTGAKNYTIESISITNANHTLVTATLGVFSAAGGTGTTMAADQAITVTNGTANTALNFQSLTLSPAATIAFNFTQLFVRIGTAEGAAATADVTICLNFFG